MALLASLVARVRRRPLPVACVAALVLAAPTLGLPWTADDFLHQLAVRAWADGEVAHPGFADAVDPLGMLNAYAFLDGQPQRTERMRAEGTLPWWVLPEVRIRFWRPLASAALLVDHASFGDFVPAHRLHTLAWLALLVWGYGAVLRRALGDTSLWGLAVLMIAVTDHHAVPVGWIANRHALISAALGGLAVLAHLRWRKDGWRPGALLAPLALAAALAGGESGLGAAAYLGAYELWGARRRRLGALVAPAAVCLLWASLYRAGDHGTYGSGHYLDPLREPDTFAAALLTRGSALLGAQIGGLPSDLWLSAPALRPVLAGAGAVVVLVTGLALRSSWRQLPDDERRGLRWLGAAGALSLIPSVAAMPSDRLLLLSELGLTPWVAILIRQGWRTLRGRAERTKGAAGAKGAPNPRRAAGLGVALGGALAVRHLALGPLITLGLTAANHVVSERSRAAAEDGARWLAEEGARRVAVVAASDPSIFMYLWPRWLLEGRPVPARWFVWSIAPQDHVLEGVAEGVYELSASGADLMAPAFARLFRGERHPLARGDVVHLDGHRITVVETEEGPAGTTAVRKIRIELDGGAGGWTVAAWIDGALRRTELPAPGARVVLPWSPGPVGM